MTVMHLPRGWINRNDVGETHLALASGGRLEY